MTVTSKDFALRWGISEFLGGIGRYPPPDTYKLDLAEQTKQARLVFESFMQQQHVPRSIEATGIAVVGWLDDVPEGDSFVGSYGRVFDVIVMSKPGENSTPGITEQLNPACSRAAGRS